MKWVCLLVSFMSFHVYAGEEGGLRSLATVVDTSGSMDVEEKPSAIEVTVQKDCPYNDLLAALECPICRNYLNQVRVVPCCKNAFCRECIYTWVEAHNSCPMCRENSDVETLECNVLMDKVLQQVPVECPGCKEGMKRESLKTHMRSCEYVFRLPVIPGVDFFVKTLLEAKLNLQTYRKFLLTPTHTNSMTVRCNLVRNETGWDLKFLEKPEWVLSAVRKRNGDFEIFVKKSELEHFPLNIEGSNLKIATLKYSQLAKKIYLEIEEGGVFCVSWEKNTHGFPHSFGVSIPKLDSEGNMIAMSQLELETEATQRVFDKSHFLINKPPIWVETLQAYCLDFGGRVQEASTKNFILVEASSLDESLVLFGKQNSNKFSLDFQAPIAPIQAMALGLSSFSQNSME